MKNKNNNNNFWLLLINIKRAKANMSLQLNQYTYITMQISMFLSMSICIYMHSTYLGDVFFFAFCIHDSVVYVITSIPACQLALWENSHKQFCMRACALCIDHITNRTKFKKFVEITTQHRLTTKCYIVFVID